MPNAFTLFGEITADTTKFDAALTRAEKQLRSAQKEMKAVEKAGTDLGQSSAVTAQKVDRLGQTLTAQKAKIKNLVDAYTGGLISEKQFAAGLSQVDAAAQRVTNSMRDAAARMQDSRRAADAAAQAVAKLNEANAAKLESSLRAAKQRMEDAEHAIAKTAQRSKDLGQSTASTGREFGKLNDRASETSRRLDEATKAFGRGEIGAKEYARAISRAENEFKGLSSRARDMDARFADMAAKGKQAGFGTTILGANLAANAISNLSDRAVDFTREGIRMNASLDQTARLVATLDKATNSVEGANRLKQIFTDLSREVPQSAQSIGEAARVLKSTFEGMSNEDLTMSLRQFGIAATAAGADVGTYTNSLAALAKAYKVELKDLPQFLAAVATANKRALASDQEVAAGFNRTVTAAQNVKISLQEYLAVVGTLQSTTNDASGATTDFLNLLAKFGDPNYIKGFKEVFNTDVFDPATGAARNFNDVLLDLIKSLDGLSDEQRTNKINSVFKDLQGRNAFLGLLNNVDSYKKALSEGSDMKQFEKNNELMLGSVESRWERFYATITKDQTSIGGRLTETFLQGLDSNSIVDGLDITFNNVGAAMLKNGTQLIKYSQDIGLSIGESVVKWFGVTDEQAAAARSQVRTIDGFWQQVDNMNQGRVATILARQRDAKQRMADIAPDENTRQRALTEVRNYNAAIENALAQMGSKQAADKLRAELFKNTSKAVTGAMDAVGPVAEKESLKVGGDIVQGLLRGMQAGEGNVHAMALKLALAAVSGTSEGVQSKSPSKVFHQIGVWVGEGFANGMNAMKPVVDKAARELVNKDQFKGIAKDIADSFRDATAKLDVSMPGAGAKMGVPGFIAGLKGKDGEAALALAGELIKKLAEMNAETDTQQILLTLAEQKYKKLTAAQIEFIKGLAAGIDAEEKTKDGMRALADIQERFNETLGKTPTELDKLNAILSDKTALEAYAKSIGKTVEKAAEWLRVQAGLIDGQELLNKLIREMPPLQGPAVPAGQEGGGLDPNTPGSGANPGGADQTPPLMPPTKAWEDFWKTFRTRTTQMRKELPSLKQALGETFIDTFSKAADILANAVANWDGTLKGFFNSVKEGFRQMISELISQLIRLMIMKAALAIIGNAASGAAGAQGSVGSATDGAGGSIPGGGHAAGGLIQGPGSGTSDSILSWLSNGEYVIPAKAVRKFGVGFFEQIRNMQTPALAGGGMMPAMAMGSSSSSYAYHNNVTVNLSGGGSDGRTGSQIARETMIALRRMEERNR